MGWIHNGSTLNSAVLGYEENKRRFSKDLTDGHFQQKSDKMMAICDNSGEDRTATAGGCTENDCLGVTRLQNQRRKIFPCALQSTV